MMVRVALRQFKARPKFAQAILEAFRRGDSANGTDVGVAETFERNLFAGQNVLEMERLVGALDDFRGPVITANPLDQLVVRLARALRDENVTGAAEITRRLAQSAAREQMFVPERRL